MHTGLYWQNVTLSRLYLYFWGYNHLDPGLVLGHFDDIVTNDTGPGNVLLQSTGMNLE